MVESHANELVGGILGIVPELSGVSVCPRVAHGRWVGGATSNDFGDQLRGERSQVTEDEMAVGVGRVLGQRRRVFQVVQG